MRLAALVAVGLILATIAPDAAQADDGKLAYNNHCRTCHSVKEGDNRLGPSLAGIVGRVAGSVDGYAFSASLVRSDVVWDLATLEAFIEAPDSVVPGHQMRPYGGIADPDVRALIIGYLDGL